MAAATPCYKHGTFLDAEEISAYKTLCEVSGDYNIVLVKVSLAELVAPPGPDRRNLDHWRRVQRRTLDFLICPTSTLHPLLAIKMCTKLDSKRQRVNSPDILDEVLKDIGLPLLRLTDRKHFEAKDLAGQIRFTLQQALEARAVYRHGTERLTA